MARPKVAEPREMTVRVRLSVREYQWLLALALKERCNLSTLGRKRLLAGMPPAPTESRPPVPTKS
jgi:hypothetical protein